MMPPASGSAPWNGRTLNPADITCKAGNARASMAAAIGLRHKLPVHRTRRVLMSVIGRRLAEVDGLRGRHDVVDDPAPAHDRGRVDEDDVLGLELEVLGERKRGRIRCIEMEDLVLVG